MMLTLLAIVQTITGIIAATVAVLAFRRSQPTQTPVANHPPSRIKKIGDWFKRVSASPWTQVLLMFGNLFNLIWAMQNPKPLSRWGVLSIVIPVAGIVLNLAFLVYLDLSRLLRNLTDTYFKNLIEQCRIDRSLLEIAEGQVDATKTGDLGILEIIKNLSTGLRVAVEPPSELPKPKPQKRKRHS
jgi:hypothetical protein